MLKLPLGVFSRSRKDWTVDNLRYSSLYIEQAAGAGYYSQMSLNNNAKNGSYLAVWGILATWSGSRPMAQANLQAGQGGNPNGIDYQLNPATPPIPGYGSANSNTLPNQGAWTMIFRADGSWTNNGDVPLFIVPPNYYVNCYAFIPLGNCPGRGEFAVTYLWGLWAHARATR